ncbi:hypothetical protein M9458_028958, partial [Cirrhinus mrigala]
WQHTNHFQSAVLSPSIQEYTIHFHTLVVASGWNEVALLSAYRQGLNLEIRAAMALYDDTIGLESFLQRTTRVSQRLAACQPPITAPQPVSVAACLPVPEPMQIDYSRLTRTEKNRCLTSGLCLYCGNNSHFIKPPRPVVSTILSEVEISNLSVTLHSSRNSLSVSALIDSGSSGNFISQECLDQLQLPRQRNNRKYAVKTIQGKPLGRGKVRYSSPFITLQIGLFYKEQIPPSASSWDARGSTSIPPYSAGTPVIPEPEITPEIPAEYMAFQEVFSKQAATQLPPHWPWDCAIELLPGAQLPKGRIYPLSILEHQAMEKYIAEALQQGYIQPSTLPAASSFFFVGKKDRGLRPSIDYRQLNSLIIQEPYPLPLELECSPSWTCGVPTTFCIRAEDEWKAAFITPTRHYEYRIMPYGLSISPSVFQTSSIDLLYIDDILIYSRNLADHRRHVQQIFQKLREHSLYLKLEKCEFHRSSVQFLGYVISAVLYNKGFSNYYRRYIQGYSMVTAPLTSLLRGKPKHLVWNPTAHKGFHRLKTIFCTAPLLRHPDPDLPFMVEEWCYLKRSVILPSSIPVHTSPANSQR